MRERHTATSSALALAPPDTNERRRRRPELVLGVVLWLALLALLIGIGAR